MPEPNRYAESQTSAADRASNRVSPADAPGSSCEPSVPSITLALVPIEIISVESSRDLRRFIDLPWKIYNRKDHPQWVPPLRIAVRDALDVKGNPFYRTAHRQLFLAVRDGTPVGRIAAIHNWAH